MLEYRTVPIIINDSLSKRTLKVVNLIFLVICASARSIMVKFKQIRYIYKRFSQLAVNDDGLSGNP